MTADPMVEFLTANLYAADATIPRQFTDAARKILALHHDAGAGQGYLGVGGYGWVEHCCNVCGAFGEYSVPWPCDTVRLLAEAYGWTGS